MDLLRIIYQHYWNVQRCHVREIPTPEVARSFSHLRHIATELPEYDPNIPIGLLIGRDLLEAHHIEKQIVGPKDSPFAQKIGLG